MHKGVYKIEGGHGPLCPPFGSATARHGTKSTGAKPAAAMHAAWRPRRAVQAGARPSCGHRSGSAHRCRARLVRRRAGEPVWRLLVEKLERIRRGCKCLEGA
jgi:hypothetical protein